MLLILGRDNAIGKPDYHLAVAVVAGPPAAGFSSWIVSKAGRVRAVLGGQCFLLLLLVLHYQSRFSSRATQH